MTKRRTVGVGVVGLCVVGVALVALGVYAQFGARVFSPPQPVFPQGIDGAGTQAGYRALFFPGAESMSTNRPFRLRRWPPGYASGTLQWSPADVKMHAVRADGSIVARRVAVSWLSPTRAPTIEIVAQTGRGRGSIVLVHAAWVWGPGVGLLGACAGVVILRRRSRGGPNSCAACGYDLRGLREGAACPECGAAR